MSNMEFLACNRNSKELLRAKATAPLVGELKTIGRAEMIKAKKRLGSSVILDATAVDGLTPWTYPTGSARVLQVFQLNDSAGTAVLTEQNFRKKLFPQDVHRFPDPYLATWIIIISSRSRLL